jgi:hypothetical protein
MAENTGTEVYNIYEKSHIPILVAFLAMYLLYIGASSVIKSTIPTVTDKQLHTAFDLFVVVIIIVYCVYAYSGLTSLQQNNILQLLWNWGVDFYSSDNMILATLLFIFVFYFIVFCFKITLHNTPYSLHILESKTWIFLAVLIIIFVINHIFSTNVAYYLYVTDDNASIWDTRFKHLSDKTASSDQSAIDNSGYSSGHSFGHSLDNRNDSTCNNNKANSTENSVAKQVATSPESNNINSQVSPETTPQKGSQQVFNVANNIYTYNDAKLVCKSIGARLATYDEVEAAYKKGGEWCNYGWTDGQMALFPTQLTTWYSLQSDNATKNSCGRPGVNGGYIMNPHQKYGVNCFGIKPAQKESDISPSSYITPSATGTPSYEELEEQKRLQFWKTYGNQIMQLNSFNRSQW